MEQGIRIRTVILLCFIMAMWMPQILSAQSCLPQGIDITTQEQIDNFQTNFPNCTKIEGVLHIEGDEISNLNGLSSLTSLGDNVLIWNNPLLTDFSGLENVTSIDGSLDIVGNNNLESMNGLNSLTHISGMLNFADYNQPYILGLENLSYIGTGFSIGTTEIIDFTGLSNLKYIGGYFWVLNNSDLESLNGLDSLSTIGVQLWLWANHSLINCNGMSMLDSIGMNIVIEDNDALLNLNGLEGIKEIGGAITIQDNYALSTLSGIDNIEAESIGNLKIVNNPSLSYCHVQSVCDYILTPNAVTNIHDNSSGCNSEQEIEDACTVGIPESNSDLLLSTYPNPFTTSTTIEYELTVPSYVQITIYNAIGEAIHLADEGRLSPGKHTYFWSPEGMPEGLYYAVLRSEGGVSVVKMLKQ